jgi:hypothetical protein
MLTPFERGFIAHLTADWLLQNDWMSKNKADLRHPAGWVHAGIYGIALGLALGWQAGLVLGVLHLLVDTRVVQRWWQMAIRQTVEGPVAVVVRIWGDQVIHILILTAWIALAPQ